MTTDTHQPHSHIKAKDLFERAADYYQQRAESKVSNFGSLMFRRRRDIVETLMDQIPSGGKILDFGMGPAVFGAQCEAKGLHYIGIDISEKMVQLAKLKQFKNAEFIVGDLDSLDAFKEKMDAVIAIGLLDYLENPFHGMAALAACVRPGGSIILSFRNRYSIPGMLRDVSKGMVMKLFDLIGKEKVSDKAFLSDVLENSFDFKRHLKPQLEKIGFCEFQVKFFNFSPFFFNFKLPESIWKKWRTLDSRLAQHRTRLMCSGGVLVAKKTA